jgi:hypothetical protein
LKRLVVAVDLTEIVVEIPVMAKNPSEENETTAGMKPESVPDDSSARVKPPDSRPKYRIPEFPKQKELTPEQLQEKEKDRRRRQAARNLKTRIRNNLFGIAIVGVLAALVYFVIAKKNRPRESDVAAPRAATDFEVVLNSTDPQEIIRYSESLPKNLLSQSLPNQITRLREQLQLGQHLIDLNADQESSRFGVNLKLDSLIILDTLNLVYDLKDTSFREQLLATASENLDNEDLAICRKAHLGICLSITHDYTRNPTDESFARLIQQFRSSTPKLKDDLVSSVSLARLVTLAAKSPRKEDVVELMNYAGTEFKQSSDESVRKLGAKIHDDIFVGNFDFNSISDQMLIGNEDSLKQLALAVDAVTANSQISEVPFSKVLALAENLSQIDRDDLREEYVSRLREASRNVTDEELSARIRQVIDDFDKRNSTVGKIFDLAGNQYDDLPMNVGQLSGKIVVVAYLGLRHRVSLEFVLRLSDYEYLVSEGVEFVVVCVDDSFSTDELAVLAEKQGVHVVTKVSAPGYLDQCPISKVPYLVVLNRQHNVVAVNVNVDKLRGLLEEVVNSSN